MNSIISLPLWMFVLLMAFAAVMVLDRILMPSVRWYLKRRVNRAIEDINTKLDIQIRPFQLTRKQALVDQLVFDDHVVKAIREYAKEHDMPSEVAQEKAVKYANEIAPTFNAYVYFRFGYWLSKRLARLLYRVRVGYFDNDQLKQIPANSSVVFVMNHRSNMDYVLVSFLVAEKTALSYAVGEWARIWPLQTLIKSMGAFFVRRNSGNKLYRKVLERYVNLATRAGVCQAVFPEGGLTRDGVMREPKLGFLDYMIRDYHPDIDRNVVFVPVGINYDRVLEDKSLVRRLDQDATRRSRWFVLKTSTKFFLKTLMMDRKKRWRRFGYASVNFGKPIYAQEFFQASQKDFGKMETEERFEFVADLAESLMQAIKKVVPVLPVALMSDVVLANQGKWCSELELKSKAVERMHQLKEKGAPIDISDAACERVLSAALDMLFGRGFVEMEDNLYRASSESISLLEYYANSINY
ncbi:MAG: 1-acyl-sn-glycerol-3-phosphate acyltransferase [Thiotrichaceae bacterium]